MKEINFLFDFPLKVVFSNYQIFDIGTQKSYIDEYATKELLQKLFLESYVPTLKLIYNTARILPEFKCSLSFSPELFEYAKKYDDEFVVLLKKVVSLDQVEIVAQKYTPNLDLNNSLEEYSYQVDKFVSFLKTEFKKETLVFRNQDLVYSLEELESLQQKGFSSFLMRETLGKTSYSCQEFKCFEIEETFFSQILKEFSNPQWHYFPLTQEKFFSLFKENSSRESFVFDIDVRYLGYFNRSDSGIFDFFKYLFKTLLEKGVSLVHLNDFKSSCEVSLSEVLVKEKLEDAKIYSKYLSNKLQVQASSDFLSLEQDLKSLQNPQLLEQWRLLGLSDHFYLMNTQVFYQENLTFHQKTAYDTYISFMNALNDLHKKVGMLKSEKSLT